MAMCPIDCKIMLLQVIPLYVMLESYPTESVVEYFSMKKSNSRNSKQGLNTRGVSAKGFLGKMNHLEVNVVF